MDSGASYHVTGHSRDLRNTRAISPPKRFTVADGRTVLIRTVGELHVQTAVDDGKNKRKYFDLTVPNVFLVPGISTTLLSVFRLVQAGNHVLFDNNSWSVTQGKRRQLVLQAVPVDGVYEVVTRCLQPPERPNLSRS